MGKPHWNTVHKRGRGTDKQDSIHGCTTPQGGYGGPKSGGSAVASAFLSKIAVRLAGTRSWKMMLGLCILIGKESTHFSCKYFIKPANVKPPRAVYIPHHFYRCNGCTRCLGEPKKQSVYHCVRRLFTHQVVYDLGSVSGRAKSAYTI